MADLQPRGYQLEMLNQSLQRNIIVAIPTGGGKTLIAALRIQAELDKGEPGKRVWFLCPTVVLAKQQCDALRRNISSTYDILLLCGDDGVDHWKSQKIWDQVLSGIAVTVCTYQVLTDALASGYVRLSEISLLVFDEAHNCQNRHASNRIMQDFYHPAKRAKAPLPWILGLTASPVNAKIESLESIEANLDALSRAPKTTHEQLLQHVHLPEIEPLLYPPQLERSPDSLVGLATLRVDMLNKIESDPYVIHLRSFEYRGGFNLGIEQKLEEALKKGKTWSQEQLKRLYTVLNETQIELGSWAFRTYLSTCLKRLFERKGAFLSSDEDLRNREIQYLSVALATLKVEQESLDPSRSEAHSPKVNLLIDALVREMRQDVTGILFVKTRASVRLLSDLLSYHPRTCGLLRIGTFVGSSNNRSRPSNISELIDAEGQDGTLEDLRKGIKNLIIATNVVEEGIDISACNLVLCFDRPSNVKSFIQRRGRARQAQSRFVIMFSDEETKKLKEWQMLEAEMKRKYMDDMRKLKELERLESDEDGYRELVIESTGAKLTLANAVQRLFNFCNRLPSVRFASADPIFEYPKKESSNEVVCVVHLPNSLEDSLRRHRSRQTWKSERRAREDASFEAVIALHDARLINDHLVPFEVLDEDIALAVQNIEKRPNIVEVDQQINVWRLLAQAWRDEKKTYLRSLTLDLIGGWNRMKSTQRTKEVLLIASLPFPMLADLHLYIDQNSTAHLRFTPKETLAHGSDTDTANQITRLVLSAGLPSRVEPHRVGFPILVMPLESCKEPAMWLEEMSGTALGSSLLKMRHEDFESFNETVGVVRDLSNNGAPYLFREISEQSLENENEPGSTKSVIRATKLPKRRDFLHEIPSGAMRPKATYDCLEIDTCTVDRLPDIWAQVAIFLPSVFHHCSIHWVAEHLRTSLFREVFVKSEDVALILTAISASAARETSNYQRLEFLGDSLLKVYVCLAVSVAHPAWHEGYLSRAKDQLVANNTLAMVAQRTGLSKYIITDAFTGAKWRPQYNDDLLASPVVDGDEGPKRELSTKVLADVVEALLAAAWVAGGEQSLLKCLRIFFPHREWLPSSRSLSILKERSRPLIAVPESLKSCIQKLTGHEFQAPSLAFEAVTHTSYNTGVGSAPSYERLEFLGDALLEYLVTLRIWSNSSCLPERWMHRIRTAIVNGPFLAFCALGHQIDVPTTVPVPVTDDRPHRKKHPRLHEDIIRFETRTTKKSILSLLRAHFGTDLRTTLYQTHGRFNQWVPKIEASLESGSVYPWTELTAFDPPKLVSDLVESIIASIAIDTGSLELSTDVSTPSALSEFLTKIGLLPWLDKILNRNGKDTPSYDPYGIWHPLEELGFLSEQETVHHKSWIEEGRAAVPVGAGPEAAVPVDGQVESSPDSAASPMAVRMHHHQVFVGERQICEASGSNASEAKTRAAQMAVEILRRERLGKLMEPAGEKAAGKAGDHVSSDASGPELNTRPLGVCGGAEAGLQDEALSGDDDEFFDAMMTSD